MTAQSPFTPAPFFVFRTPLLPWSDFEAWAGAPVKVEDEAAFRTRQASLRSSLSELIKRPDIQEALFLASPDLMDALPRWVNDPDSEKGARCERGLVRYFARLCGRSTPFGLFAGCSRGQAGEATRLTLAGREHYRRHTRLDMDYLCSLSVELAKDPEVAGSLLLKPNSSIYAAGGRLRYAEGVLRDRSRSYHLVAVEETPYLLETLKRAEPGATAMVLAQALVEDEITLEDALGYISELVQSQVLVAELTPAVTGPEPIQAMIAQLQTIPAGLPAAEALARTNASLTAIDDGPLGSKLDPYLSIAEDLKALPAKVELNRLFQTDLVKPSPDAQLGTEVTKEVQSAITLLHRLQGQGGKGGPIERFRDSFSSRYEEQEVPLVDALDEESGIGFQSSQGPSADTSPLLEGLMFPGAASEGGGSFSALEAFLMGKLIEGGGAHVMRLEEKDLEPYFHSSATPLPSSISVMGRVAAASPEHVVQGDFKFVFMGASGPSGANLLGRFCHGDEQLTADVREYLQQEEAHRPDAVFAEVVHLPEGRIGNVILRPLLRGYEIPFLGRSGAPEDHQIPVTDLMISVKAGRIVLRSKRLGKEVLPRLSTAHNYSHRSLGIYRFLCMLQHQGVLGGLGWSWSSLENLPFLPRLEVGRTVLATARWKVETKPLKAAIDAKGFARWEAFQTWRAAQKLPRWVYLADGDNRLPLDLDNPLMVDSMLDLVKPRGGFQLDEFYPEPNELCAEGPEGRFIHELVIPMSGVPQEASAPRPELSKPREFALPRTFLPGSEWIFAKIYGGPAAMDQMLRERMLPLLQDLRAVGAIDGWFFIRYADPEGHVRVRFHGDPARLNQEVLPRLEQLSQELQSVGLVRNMVLDTYQRELERYGGDEGMHLSERLFEVDSDAVLGLVSLYAGDAGADVRWRFGVKGLDDLLEAMGLDLAAKHRLLERMKTNFLREFNGGTFMEKQLGDRFRRERPSLQALLEGKGALPPHWEEGLRVLEQRLQAMRPIGEALRAKAEAGAFDLEDLASSYLHMHVNRLLRGSHRAHEMVMYDFLFRIYDSRLARMRKSQPVS